MRDFRDAKAMAHTLRAALVTKGHKVTNSESLELIAQAFGVADWNTLSASIHEETAGPRNNATTPPQPSTTQSGSSVFPHHPIDESGPAFSPELLSTLDRALAYANQRRHEYTTLEHLLLALTDDEDASAVMSACKVDLGTLKDHLRSYIDNDLKRIVIDGGETKPSVAFGRVMRCAEGFALGRGRPALTGAEVLVPIFFEKLSPAARFLGKQDMTRQDAVNFIIHGIAKGGGEAAA